MMIFIAIFLWIIALLHFQIYYFFQKSFNLKWSQKIFLISILLFLLSSYFLARLIWDNFENIFTYSFSYFASVWLWVLFAFFIFIFCWLIILFLLKIFNLHFDNKILWYFIIMLVSIYTFTWLINANNIIIKEEEIKLVDFPSVWKDKKIIFFADLHLWNIIRENYLNKVIEKINKEKPDIVLISWDLFDWVNLKFDYFVSSFANLEAKDWVFLVAGNHDFYLWYDNFKRVLEKSNITLLQNDFVDIDGVQVVWIDYTIQGDYEAIAKNIKELISNWYTKSIPSILLFHEPTFFEYFKENWIDLVLSGHTHWWQIWPFNYVVEWYFDWLIHWLYDLWDDMKLYLTNWVGTWWPPMRIGNTSEIVILKIK